MDIDTDLQNFDDKDNEPETDGTHIKPCRTCRKRKVRCSKTDPCSNCERAGQDCVYNDHGAARVRRRKSNAALAERVVQLEKLVGKLSQHSSPPTETAGPQCQSLQAQSGRPIYIADKVAQTIQDSMSSDPMDRTALHQGRLITSGGLSRHLMNAFWASMYDEIGDLKHMLQAEPSPQIQCSFMFHASNAVEPPLCTALTPSNGDFLMHAFCANVDQFVRILHKPTILTQLNHLRRGILVDASDFVCQLSAIYSLAILSLSNEDCLRTIGEPRAVLLNRCRGDVERGLARLNITVSHKLSSLQTLLLHISYLTWTGEILHASSLLGLAIRMAQRLGIHRDGTSFGLTPWPTELRRRIWHCIIFIDTWCMENHGLETAIPSGFSDTRLPQNVDDSAWDTTDSSTVQPPAKNGFTDMTFTLMQYEAAAAMRVVLNNSVPLVGDDSDYTSFHTKLRLETWREIERTYINYLDPTDLRQNLTLEIARLSFERMHLTQLRPMVRGVTDPGTAKELERKLLRMALDFCNTVQQIRQKYEDRRLDWAIIRVFSWHALATEISTCLSKDGISTTPEAESSRQKIAMIFRDCPSIDYLKGNDSLWQPLRRLQSELELRRFADEQVFDPAFDLESGSCDSVWNDKTWETF